eukprot:TRINITY_DN302_c0_g2_i2.p1 TRINITY_DN302_c0_g2~~TRINITY_DN302_c0_g2_i2.p1  ORF type:complete len:197 (-),score=24.91 TRINITY_DN302_c0_g2_i2:132-722(-)
MALNREQIGRIVALIYEFDRENEVISLRDHWANPSGWLDMFADNVVLIVTPNNLVLNGMCELLKYSNHVDSPYSHWGNPSVWLRLFRNCLVAYINENEGRVDLSVEQKNYLMQAIYQLDHENEVVSPREHWANPSDWIDMFSDNVINIVTPNSAFLVGMCELLKRENTQSRLSHWGNPSSWLRMWRNILVAYINEN